MADKKQEVAETGKQQAGLLVNNAFIDGLAAQLKTKEEYGLTFPPDYNPTNALNGAYLILKETKDKSNKYVLETCSQSSIANSLLDMVTMGLSAQKKQCYFVPYGGKLQCMVSYHGHKTMAHRYGAKNIISEVIYEDDEFSYHIENGRKILDKHKQDFRNIDLAKVVGAYCIIELSDGNTYMEVMNIKQIETAWKKGFGYKKGSGTHSDFTDMMAKKTVTSRACKQIVQQYGDVFAQEAFENAEERSGDDITAIDAQYDIKSNANSEDFDEPDVIDGEYTEAQEPEQSAAAEEVPDCFQ